MWRKCLLGISLFAFALSLSSASAQQEPLLGVWITRVPTQTGIDGQGWVEYFGNGTFFRMSLMPRSITGAPASCQIAGGRWRAQHGGQMRTLSYVVDNYEPHLCGQAPLGGTICEPPPSDFGRDTTVQFSFNGPNNITSMDGTQWTRAPAMPPVPPYCHDGR
jgi:hypothetical protein